MSIIVKKAGWQTLVMDQGRRNTRHLGIPVSGITDYFRYWWACGLVGHWDFENAGLPVLEIRTGVVEIYFDHPHAFAIAGSPGEFYLNNKQITTHTAYLASKNDTLELNTIRRNGTIYLAISGIWNITKVFGSASADILSPFPGTAGRTLIDGERIEIKPSLKNINYGKSPNEYLKNPPEYCEPILRITAGPELHQCDRIIYEFSDSPITISRDSNRMGYRLMPEMNCNFNPHPMLSSIVFPGTIQWPAGNEPILLLPNCQTTGGYPRVAKVIDADIWKLAYLGPGDKLIFKWTTREEALYLKKYTLGQFTQQWNTYFPQKIRNHHLWY